MISLFVAYFLIIAFMVIERSLRIGENAKSMISGEADRQSTGRLSQAFALAVLLLLLAPLLNYFRIGSWQRSWLPGWLGVALMVVGIALRFWAAKVLGKFYTRTLLTSTDQRIVEEGPYRFLRHPGYSGSLLVWIGAGLAAANWIIFAIITLVMLTSYIYRMRTEEAMLAAQFGQAYRDYVRRTRRIIPFLY